MSPLDRGGHCLPHSLTSLPPKVAGPSSTTREQADHPSNTTTDATTTTAPAHQGAAARTGRGRPTGPPETPTTLTDQKQEVPHMPYKTRITSSPMLTHPCPACHRLTRADGYCRTPHCPNRVPDDLIAPAREQALAEMRETIRTARQNRMERSHD